MCDAFAVISVIPPSFREGDQAELMALLCVRTMINSYNNSEHLPVSVVERGSMDCKFDAEMGCLGVSESECMDPVLS